MVCTQITTEPPAPPAAAVPATFKSVAPTAVEELLIVDVPFVPHFHWSENWIEVLGATYTVSLKNDDALEGPFPAS
jgi:hypothetical protein